MNPNKVLISLLDRQTGRILWKRRCRAISTPVCWSPAHDALALSFADLYEYPNGGQFRLLYWRRGRSPRLVGHPDQTSGFDEVADMRWSPDATRFAFLGGSTLFDSGGPIIGTLVCVDATTGHFFIGPRDVGRYQWVGPAWMRYVIVHLIPDPHHPPFGIFKMNRPQYWAGKSSQRLWLYKDK